MAQPPLLTRSEIRAALQVCLLYSVGLPYFAAASVIPLARSDTELAHPSRRRDSEADLPVFAVLICIRRLVTDDVLALQLQRNLFARVLEIGDGCSIRMSTCHLGDVADQGTAEIDDVDLRVGFAHEVANVAAAVAAVIVLAVRN